MLRNNLICSSPAIRHACKCVKRRMLGTTTRHAPHDKCEGGAPEFFKARNVNWAEDATGRERGEGGA